MQSDKEFSTTKKLAAIAGEVAAAADCWKGHSLVCLKMFIRTDQDLPTQTQIPRRSDAPSSSSAPITQPSLSTTHSTDTTVWKPRPGDTRQLLPLNVDRCIWDLTLSMTKMRQVWEVKVGDQMRDLLGNAWTARKRSDLIHDPVYKTFCEYNKRNRNEGPGEGSREAHGWFYLLHRASQGNLTERFSKRRHLEELYNHQTGAKKGQYTKFYKARQKAEEEATATGAPIPDDLQLMATISGGLSHDRLYGACSDVAHLRTEAVGPQLDCHLVVWKRCRGSLDGLRLLFLISMLPSTST
ncbi:hypothetical protein M9H77_16247 [Catharanthus roseus]|uniref:Uncharacterized protein n=1 Tax=Catharanthus roseus TaxID=4058 RepID=A0ACC0B0F7_CATRO|nr:hypothetical protein M9H77_16247 [Catharanthus roseus]